MEKQRLDIFLAVIHELGKQGDIVKVAEASNVHFTTLYKWMRDVRDGGTVEPRLSTLIKVLPALGLELEVKRNGRRLRLVA